MKKQLLIVLIVLSPLFSQAGENDSLSIHTVTSKTIDNDSITVLDSTLVVHNDSTSIEEEVYLSYEIVPFDMNKIPVDVDLFNYHVSTREFQVPMDYNFLVKKQIDYFGTRWQVKLKEMVTKSQYFFPLYEEILNEYDLPLEIKYLSIIESALNPYAKSRSGAVGAWQFMPATAKIFNLKVNSKVDERRSLEKSTRAACIYLRQMYNLYDDWLVALASYNCGPGNVRKAIRLSESKDFWGMYNYLPRETQNYVPKFIAMTYMMNFYDEYGIIPAPYEADQYRYQQVYCQEGLDFGIIAEKIGLSKEELLKYNPEMKVGEIPYIGDGYKLNIPEDVAFLFYQNREEILAVSSVLMAEKRLTSANKTKVHYYYVKKGESLPIIARRQGCTVTQLKQWNGIRGSLIYPKQRLKIYRI